MLTFAEEILLLSLDDKKGSFLSSVPEQALRTALAGALLMELAVMNRIDTDLHALFVVAPDPTPDTTGDPLLDDVLQRIQTGEADQPAAFWLNEIAWKIDNLRDRVVQGLVEKGVLKIEDRKVLWVFPQRRYPLLDDREVKEVRARLRDLLFGGDIPEYRDAVLVGLVHSCGMVETLFSDQELPQVMPRLTKLAQLDLIGREVDRAIREIMMAMTAHNIRGVGFY
ncbi:Golgi phosphoprotein 3 (GPP34) [Desulfonatronum zhilinae]|nr:Golgi phosphoprotein 3 (GPP34) [Desulfonatronum zhilinae]